MVIPNKHLRYYIYVVKKGGVVLARVNLLLSPIQIMDAKNQAKDFAPEDLP
jgi:hypothetical protein